ncbi:monocarboxylate transporter 10-like [Belonocnema kinseyi]|uniref:monocarboxylate transporter 10-like n=1 Tax=Belonocnema kinseyi TaxID=2817044 RepID=UPI00143DEDB5|nr:monocarboxylate transporter 10-like [Belonocnema kinseyi]
MLVDECGGGMGWSGSVRGGWSTPGGCGNSAMSFGGSVPSLHPTGSIRSLRSQHSTMVPPATPRRCLHCHPVRMSTPNNYVQHPVQYYTPSRTMDGQNGTYIPQRNSYHGDPRPHYNVDVEESVAGNTNWVLGDLRSLHRCVPALRRTGIDVAGIQTHFYPEGGWGWLVCAAGFLALLLTTGMQLAFGLLHLYAVKHLGEMHLMDIAWVGALSAAVSRGSAPLVVGACRRGSTRLIAVIGGLVLALASLFTSFALQMHQVILSYGLVLGAGAGLVRETAGLVLGHYFRKRLEFVEMIVQAGTGVGIVLFSVFYKEAVGKLGWRLGLQSVTGALSLTFFLGLIYRSASLYHPQRRAIVHLKNQKSKLREKKSATKVPQQRLVDLRPLSCRPVRMLMLAAGSAAFGLYTPVFYIKGAEAARLDKLLSRNPDAILWTLKLPGLGYSESDGDTLAHLIKAYFPGFTKSGDGGTAPLRQSKSPGFHVIGYAEDILVVVRGQHLDPLFGVMQQTVRIVDSWCKGPGLSVNPSKTDVVAFTRRYKWGTKGTLKLEGQKLKIKGQAKYLGVTLDKKLSWH